MGSPEEAEIPAPSSARTRLLRFRWSVNERRSAAGMLDAMAVEARARVEFVVDAGLGLRWFVGVVVGEYLGWCLYLCLSQLLGPV